jgi:hypothetical protein
VPTFADRECHVVSLTDPYGYILGFLDWSRYFFFQVADAEWTPNTLLYGYLFLTYTVVIIIS